MLWFNMLVQPSNQPLGGSNVNNVLDMFWSGVFQKPTEQEEVKYGCTIFTPIQTSIKSAL
jgi:hypothetical protein